MHGDDPKIHPSTLRWMIALSVVAAVLFAINLTAPPEPPRQALGQAQPPFASTLPFRRDDGEYAGSDSCRDCHANEHKSWHASYHRTMTQLMSPETVRAAFDGQAHEFQGERFTMH
ncbi:MAG: hypothetical protein OSB61_11075, partial [Verrucomicrobiota bacterium]|nr:hypothetical protein [Verrucomicrobiota bacterium]